MKTTVIREEVDTFTQACQALADFVHHHRLTEHECMVVVSFMRALKLEVKPPIPLLSPDAPLWRPSPTSLQSTEMTKSEAAALQVKWTQHVDLPFCEHLKVELEQTEGGDVSGTYRCTTCGEVVPQLTCYCPFRTCQT